MVFLKSLMGAFFWMRVCGEVGHHIARVVALLTILQARDHPALLGPGLRAIHEFTDFALLDTGLFERILHVKLHELGNLLQPRIARQANDVMHASALAVVQDALSAKARVTSKDNAHARPLLTQAFDQ